MSCQGVPADFISDGLREAWSSSSPLLTPAKEEECQGKTQAEPELKLGHHEVQDRLQSGVPRVSM